MLLQRIIFLNYFVICKIYKCRNVWITHVMLNHCFIFQMFFVYDLYVNNLNYWSPRQNFSDNIVSQAIALPMVPILRRIIHSLFWSITWDFQICYLFKYPEFLQTRIYVEFRIFYAHKFFFNPFFKILVYIFLFNAWFRNDFCDF